SGTAPRPRPARGAVGPARLAGPTPQNRSPHLSAALVNILLGEKDANDRRGGDIAGAHRDQAAPDVDPPKQFTLGALHRRGELVQVVGENESVELLARLEFFAVILADFLVGVPKYPRPPRRGVPRAGRRPGDRTAVETPAVRQHFQVGVRRPA